MRRTVLASAMLFLLGYASAQISPGPLARPHQSLDGATQCASCHKFGGGEAAFKCLDCHTEIAERLAARRGLHATFGIQPGLSKQCIRCHSDHNGRDFPLIKFDLKSFDHKQTGYTLEGKHAGLTCNRCHSPEKITTAQKQSIKVRDLSKTFLGLSSACTTCHQDAHKGRLGNNCAQCHNSTDWKNTSGKFDHSKTQFPLTGLHAQVKCEQCHTSGPDNQPRFKGLPFSKCSDCHTDPHKGSFAQTCESCHNTSGWKRISSSALSKNFDHSKTKYPLLGKHLQVDCTSCHRKGNFKQPVAFAKCTDCHADEHQGQFAKRAGGIECSSCHTVEGFKPTTFGLKEHQSTAYPLQGKHATLECAQCHIPKGKETVFKLKFERCLECHKDEHQGQFAAAPYLNRCEQCHTLDGYKPSTFGLARHKEARFVLTGAHVAVTCVECHKAPAGTSAQVKTAAIYHFHDMSCTTCHQDPHRGQFRERMQRPMNGKPGGCETCHTTKTWKELVHFDHSQTEFPLMGAHRAVACIDCHRPPNMETKLMNVDFHAAPKLCQDCHEDIHGAQFAKAGGVTACADCHNSGRWKPSLFDHDKRTTFSLQGAHRNVRCGDCHKTTRVINGKAILFYKPTPKECSDCHGANVPTGKGGTALRGPAQWKVFNFLTGDLR